MTGLPLLTPTEMVCCSPLLREPIDEEQAERLSRVLRALADPVRLRLVSIVAASEGQEACVCDLVEPVGLSQPTVSHHLKVLREAGIVGSERRGLWAYYYVHPEAVEELSAWLAG